MLIFLRSQNKNQKLTELFQLKGTFKGHLLQPLAMNRDTYISVRLLKALSSLILNVSKDRASTTSLGNLFQCLTTLIVKNFFITFNLNLPSFSWKSFSLVLSKQKLLKCLSISFL